MELFYHFVIFFISGGIFVSSIFTLTSHYSDLKKRQEREILGYEVRAKCECGTELNLKLDINHKFKRLFIHTEKCMGCHQKFMTGLKSEH